MSLLLMKPEVDVWKPGQHTGTFRGNQLAFVAATAALENWKHPALVAGIAERSELVERCLRERIATLAPNIEVRGRGLIWGLDVSRAGGPAVAKVIGDTCFSESLIIEHCGREDTVLKLLPPLNIELAALNSGLEVLVEATKQAFSMHTESSRVLASGAA
jgi:diaminobutyrate-2-oxoglutarate transaminase